MLPRIVRLSRNLPFVILYILKGRLKFRLMRRRAPFLMNCPSSLAKDLSPSNGEVRAQSGCYWKDGSLHETYWFPEMRGSGRYLLFVGDGVAAGARVVFPITIRFLQKSPLRTWIADQKPFTCIGPKFWPLTVRLHSPVAQSSFPAVPIG
jgi:hypothetical protein